MKFIQVTNWDDLPALAGINALTGEACVYSQRLLCDVNASGLELLQEFFGTPSMTLAAPWNSQVNEAPSVGSIMLARGMLSSIAEFALASRKALALLYVGKDLKGGIFDPELLEAYSKAELTGYELHRLTSSQAPTVGSRNVHAATGRAL